MPAAVETVWPLGAVLGEGALWNPADGCVWFVDIKKPAVHRWRWSDGATTSWPMPERVGFVVPRAAGGFVLGLKSGLALWTPGSDPRPWLAVDADRPDNRLNDATTDTVGRLWFGSMDDSEAGPTGRLWRLAPDGPSASPQDGPYVVTNGPAVSPDGATLYHTDTVGRTVWAFDLSADGTLSNRRAFVRFGDGDGYPDGMATDAEGGLWVCHWGGGRITRFRADGGRDRAIALPAPQVTKCAFAGPGLDRLVVTTAAIGLDRTAHPQAGDLFRIDPGVRGWAPPPVAG
ncbi:gluconolaconase [Thalassobaculum fulvum]|uniref:Gluconolaconase n=1 Tax=Thalassobaculum fulvum TaxID=1633335 RepID=A0A919CR61_9PROT|nr:SMP-30/gluconolactonase/LRE family protein [Thalassobaculum fulvum]GHD57527.1 gluconolaconase [Thalassobaculum fulvum]